MLSNLVALLSSRVFVGYPLNRNETWVRIDGCPFQLFVNGGMPQAPGHTWLYSGWLYRWVRLKLYHVLYVMLLQP